MSSRADSLLLQLENHIRRVNEEHQPGMPAASGQRAALQAELDAYIDARVEAKLNLRIDEKLKAFKQSLTPGRIFG